MSRQANKHSDAEPHSERARPPRDSGASTDKVTDVVPEGGNWTWAGLAVFLFRFFAARPAVLFAVLLVVVLFYIGLRISGRDPLSTWLGTPTATSVSPSSAASAQSNSTSSPGLVEPVVDGGAPDSLLGECISIGRRHNRPYVIQSVVMHADMEIIEHGGGKASRQDRIRNIYTLIPLREVREPFEEWFMVAPESGGSVMRWYGSEPETETSARGKYIVQFTSELNHSRTIVTGANFEYALPLPSGRRVFRDNIPLSDKDDFFAYPNGSDVICELMIIVESGTLELTPWSNAARRLANEDKGSLIRDMKNVVLHPQQQNVRPAQRSMSARWTLVLPNEEVGLFFTLTNL